MVRENFSYIFLLGIQEIQDDEDKVTYEDQDQKWTVDVCYDLPGDKACDLCNKISVALETKIWKTTGEKAEKPYLDKTRLLLRNLKTPQSQKFRHSILGSKLKLTDVIKLTATDFLSDEAKKKRKEEEEKTIREQMILAPTTVVSKSHKGEEFIEVGKEKGDSTGDEYSQPKPVVTE